MGSLYFSLRISYNQPLFLVAQSGDAISGGGAERRGGGGGLGAKTVMFSDSQRLLWSRKCPGVFRVSHTPSALVEHKISSESSPLFSLSGKEKANCVTEVRWASPTVAWAAPLRRAASAPCQTCYGRIRHKKLGEQGGSRSAASGSFLSLCSHHDNCHHI